MTDISPQFKAYMKKRKEGLIHDCPKHCHGADMNCDCRKTFRFELQMAEASIPTKFWHLNYAQDYTGDQIPKKKVLKYIDKLAQAKEKGIGLYLTGDNGVGKTFSGCEVLKAALRQGYSARFIMMDEIVSLLTSGWRDEATRAYFEQDVLQRDFLYLDDSGKEYKPKDTSLLDATFDKMFRTRANELLPTIISSNETIGINAESDGKENVGKSLLSLFHEHLILVTFRGKDYRKESISPTLEKELFG